MFSGSPAQLIRSLDMDMVALNETNNFEIRPVKSIFGE